MNRLTIREEAGKITAKVDEDEVLSCLASYEDAHEAIILEYERVCKQIADRKAQGNMKGVTANQLIAQKMSLQNMLSYFARYGVD